MCKLRGRTNLVLWFSKSLDNGLPITFLFSWVGPLIRSVMTGGRALTLIGMRQGTFTPLVISGWDFVSWICIKNFQTFLEVKIDINRVNLTPCQAYWVLQNLLLGGAKYEHFSCFLSSCQLGFKALSRSFWAKYQIGCFGKIVLAFSSCFFESSKFFRDWILF